MIRQIVHNFIANNDINIALYMSTISVGSDQRIYVLSDEVGSRYNDINIALYSRRELLLRNVCMLLNVQCEKSRVPPRNEFVFVN